MCAARAGFFDKCVRVAGNANGVVADARRRWKYLMRDSLRRACRAEANASAFTSVSEGWLAVSEGDEFQDLAELDAHQFGVENVLACRERSHANRAHDSGANRHGRCFAVCADPPAL